MEALDLGATAWENAGAQQWDLSITRQISLPGGGCGQKSMSPLQALYRIPRLYSGGVPAGPLRSRGKDHPRGCKRSAMVDPRESTKNKGGQQGSHPSGLPKGRITVAKAYAVNSDDVERMILVKDPLPEKEPEPLKESTPFRPKTAPSDPMPDEVEKPHTNFSKANIGPLGPKAYETVHGLLYECRAFFPADLKVVNVISGKEVSIPLYDENVSPVDCEAQREVSDKKCRTF